MTVIKKILTWIGAFLPTIFGLAEAVLKFVKEFLTLVADILYPIIPSDKFKNIVTKVRGYIDVAYQWLSDNKDKVLAWLNLIP